VPRPDGTLLQRLLDSADRNPEKIAVRTDGAEMSFATLRQKVLCAAARLRDADVRPGDRVMFSLSNGLNLPVVYFAIHAAGAIAVPVAPDLPDPAFAALAVDCEPKFVIGHRGAPVEELLTLGGEALEPVCAADDIADLLYTTGTTGAKKGVVLTHAAILAASHNMTAFIGTRPDDVELVPLPLSHSFGLGRLRCLALVGHTLILEPGVGNGAPVIRRLLQHRPTGLAMVPAGFEILRQVTGDSLGRAASHLRYVEIGSAAMRPQTREWLMRMLPETRICHHYGLTEASRAAFTEYHSDPGGTAGRAAPDVTITICDERQNPVAAGQSGEVVVNGGMLLREYWKGPDLTARNLCAHGLRTGDIGSVDADGYLFLHGRQSDLINVGGRKVIPDEVEEAIREIAGVRDAACVGEADPLTGERVKAFIAAAAPLQLSEVAAFLRNRIEPHKIPSALELVDAVPRTSSGKLQRNLLRAPRQVVNGS
jgi:long-chain acyl-CoA synthetase